MFKLSLDAIHYGGITPKILIEPLMRDDINTHCEEIQWYCFREKPKLCLRIDSEIINKTTLYNENLKVINDLLTIGDNAVFKPCDELIIQSFDLSKKLLLSRPNKTNFKFVRIDWMVYKNKLWFEELTFTPYSGFNKYLNFELNKQFGKWLKIERS